MARLGRVSPALTGHICACLCAPIGGMGIGMASAFVFPGQGCQVVGMGKSLAQAYGPARRVFEEVDEALGERLSVTIFEGPAERLTLTENAQPALMAVSLAAVRALEAEAGLNLQRDCTFVAGHSLGEYSALAAAGSLSVADAARLLRIRGQAMQKAVPVGLGAMAALLGLDLDTVRAVAKEAAAGEVCEAANDNGGGQVVISGNRAAVERAIELAKLKGAKRAVMLPVSAPFHCALMRPAADVMAGALAGVTVVAPKPPVVANVAAHAVIEPAAVVRCLVEQVTGTVRWRDCVAYMASKGVTQFYEVGSGKVLTGLIRRIAEGVGAGAIGTPEDVEAFKAARIAQSV
jgi:[acyl-carrier-protein] S-malonyltransferase